MEKINRKKYPLGNILYQTKLEKAILDKLDELIEENKTMAGRIINLEKRLTKHTHAANFLASFD